MQLMDQDLTQLIARGAKDGYLTYDEVNAYLPDEDVNPEKLNTLLLALERRGISLIETTEKKARVEATKKLGSSPQPNFARLPVGDEAADEVRIDEDDFEPTADDETATVDFALQDVEDTSGPILGTAADLPKASEDPIRMYLSQMAEIPLLTRDRKSTRLNSSHSG